MNRWPGLRALILVAGTTSASFGQMGGRGFGGPESFSGRDFGSAGVVSSGAREYPVQITAGDGKTTSGTLRMNSAVLGCPLGIYEIKPEKVKEIRFPDSGQSAPMLWGQSGVQRPGAIVTTKGEVIDRGRPDPNLVAGGNRPGDVDPELQRDSVDPVRENRENGGFFLPGPGTNRRVESSQTGPARRDPPGQPRLRPRSRRHRVEGSGRGINETTDLFLVVTGKRPVDVLSQRRSSGIRTIKAGQPRPLRHRWG